MTGDLYLLDKSALARIRHASVAKAVEPLFDAGLVATCSITDLEVLYSARDPDEYEHILTRRRQAYVLLPLTQAVCDRAVEVQRELAVTSAHRGPAIPDLLIAACAEAHGATVMHYDTDYDLISGVTGQPTVWVVPRGTVP